MLKANILKKIRTDKKVKAKLQIALDKQSPTIQRYLDANSIMLTTAPALSVIRDAYGLTDSEILNEITVQ